MTFGPAHGSEIMGGPEVQLWLWVVTDEVTGNRRQTRYRMTEEDARARFGDDAEKCRARSRCGNPLTAPTSSGRRSSAAIHE
jgi:hypothetical protein